MPEQRRINTTGYTPTPTLPRAAGEGAGSGGGGGGDVEGFAPPPASRGEVGRGCVRSNDTSPRPDTPPPRPSPALRGRELEAEAARGGDVAGSAPPPASRGEAGRGCVRGNDASTLPDTPPPQPSPALRGRELEAEAARGGDVAGSAPPPASRGEGAGSHGDCSGAGWRRATCACRRSRSGACADCAGDRSPRLPGARGRRSSGRSSRPWRSAGQPVPGRPPSPCCGSCARSG